MEALTGPLLNFGMSGIFIVYLIYDRQVILKKLFQQFELSSEKIGMKLDRNYDIMGKLKVKHR